MLDESVNGIVSSRALRPELEKLGIENVSEINTKLKLFDFDNPPPGVAEPSFRYFHRGRSFYSEDAYRQAEAETERAAEQAEQAAKDEKLEDDEPIRRRRNRQEEARVVTYVEEALESIYDSDFGPDVQVAFDVHNERPGGEFENVDAIAVNWRSDDVVELVAVEVKLKFCAGLVQQAINYRRFAHRVWIAIPVSSDEPASELRAQSPSLFEYVIEQGLGILACRRRQGASYEVWPIHWPQLNRLDTLSQDEFVERYRNAFETSGVVEPREQYFKPRLR